MQTETVEFLDKHQFGNLDETKYAVRYRRDQLGSCCGIQVIYDIAINSWRYDEYDEESSWRQINFSAEANSVKERAFNALALSLFQPTKYRLMASSGRNSVPRSELPNEEIRSFNTGILIAADYVRLRGKNTSGYYTREFCECTDWTTDGLAVKNPNSDNYVQYWNKIVTPKVKVNPHYTVSEVVDITNETLNVA